MHATIFTLALSKQSAWLRSGEQCVAGTQRRGHRATRSLVRFAMAGALRAETGWRGPLERIADEWARCARAASKAKRSLT
jgi:hypothetical protein